MRIYLKNNPAKLYPYPIFRRRSLWIFGERRPNNKKNNKHDEQEQQDV